MDPAGDGPRIAEVVAAETDRLIGRLRALAPSDLLLDSRLPRWSRATVLCHLRYGAVALSQMTDDTVAGRESSFYPRGRDRQRPGTLELANGERLDELVDSLASTSAALGGLVQAEPGPVGDEDP